MVNREVKNKTRIYGSVAVLSAMFIASLIFVFGSTPGFTPALPGIDGPNTAFSMPTFDSYDALKDYIVSNQGTSATIVGGPLDSQYFGQRSEGTLSPSDSGNDQNVYSTTNIQVAGVDEADIVKTDGKFIYAASNSYSNGQNHVYIMKAEPQDPRVIAKIALANNTYLAGMFLSQDSNRLVIIGSKYQPYTYEIMIYPRRNVETFINVYDVSDKEHPVLARNVTLSGSYFNSRMIENYVYTVVSESAYVLQNGSLPLPKVYLETVSTEVDPSSIYYADKAYYSQTEYNYFTYTSFIGLNIYDNEQALTNMTVLMGGAGTMYVSLDNIYVTHPVWSSEEGEYTMIYRISVAQDKLAFEAKGSVRGYVLNQYSMDEYEGYFRLATTLNKDSTENNVYVLNMNLTTVGKLEDLAVTERIYSARFMGDKAYLVTFRQIDPFFVLDLSNPAEPKVAGELKIPGYSSYLHLYDMNHVIGLGMENNTVKLSLFDVTNINSPTETAKYIVEGDWTYSDALNDPKAFLFDEAKELLVIPVSITRYGVVEPEVANASEVRVDSSTQGYWQGAYVFKLTLTDGFELRGEITHRNDGTNQQYYWYDDYNLNVKRALFIDDTLYTISNSKVKLNSLTDLTLITEVKLN